MLSSRNACYKLCLRRATFQSGFTQAGRLSVWQMDLTCAAATGIYIGAIRHQHGGPQSWLKTNLSLLPDYFARRDFWQCRAGGHLWCMDTDVRACHLGQ